MNVPRPSPDPDLQDDVSALIELLIRTEKRLEQLTAGEIDTVAGRDGRIFLLRRALDEVRQSDAARQAAILNALPAHIAMIDARGQITSVNEAWRQFADANAMHSPGHAIGVNYLAICDQAQGIGSAEARQVSAGIRSVLREETSRFSIEYPCDSPTGQRWFLMTVTRLIAGHAVGAVVMHLNITERKLTESTLQRQQAELRALFDLMPAMIWFKDTENGILRVNQRVAQAAGMSVAEIEGRSAVEIYPQDAARFHADDLEVMRSGVAKLETIETLHDPDGRQRWIQTDKVPYFDHNDQVIGIVVMARDITTSKQAEQALRASEQNMAAAQRIAHFGSWELELTDPDADANALRWSDEMFRIAGYQPGAVEVSNELFFSMVPVDEHAAIRQAVTAAIAQRSSYSCEHRLIRPSGEIRCVHETGQVCFDETTGNPLKIIGTAHDVTESRRVELALRESRQRLALATQSVHIGIWDRDLVANTTVWDSQMFALYGVHERDFIDPNDAWQSGVLPQDRARVDAAMAATLATGEDLDCEFRIVRSGGEVRDLHAHAVMQYDGDGAPIRLIGVNWDVTERNKAESSLRDSESRFRQMAESISDVFFLREAGSGKMLYLSPAYEAIWGCSRERLYANPEAWAERIHPDDRSVALQKYREGLVSGSLEYQYRIVRPDGLIRWIETRSYPVRDGAGNMVRVAGIAKDITERKRADARISYLTRVYAMLSGTNSLIARVRDRDALFEGACRIAVDEGGFRHALICTVDCDSGRIVPAASAGMQELFLSAIRNLLASNDDAPNAIVSLAVRLKQTLVSNDSLSDPRVLLGKLHAEAGIRSIAVFPLVIADRAVASLTLYATEIEFFQEDELKLLGGLAGDIAFAIDHLEKTARLDYLAYYDELTGLANRRLFLERVAQSVRDSAVAGGGTLTMILIDLERFKNFNDLLGRPAGDALLIRVADRLKRTLHDASLLARVGADQFAVVIPEGSDASLARFVENRSALLEDSFRLDGALIRVAAKFGVARFPEDGADAEQLFRNAEVALKLAKSSGQRFAYFSNEMNVRNAQRAVLEVQLRTAIDEQQFVVFYQARVDMISGEIVGAEALIRWQHPEKGLVAPGDFITMAEEFGLIVPIGAWVLDTVCAQQAAWIAAGIRVVPVAVNLAAAQFAAGDLRETVRSVLAAHSLPPRHLELELTESAVMKDASAASTALQALRALGVGLALDDFGTGYSSLAHLKRFPFSAVKIDRSFVTDITSKPEDAAIAAAIIAMARGLSLTVIAEGVETEGQFHYLRTLGCDEMQGYFFSRPVSAEEYATQLATGKRLELPDPAALDQRTMLIVDDEQNIGSALTRLLRRDGYRILTAQSGQEGLDLLALNRVQVIISDQRMPGMTGTDFLDRVRKLHPATVRILLSGYTELGVVTDSVNRGAVFKFLTKPWDDKVLREQVREAFRLHQEQHGTT